MNGIIVVFCYKKFNFFFDIVLIILVENGNISCVLRVLLFVK